MCVCIHERHPYFSTSRIVDKKFPKCSLYVKFSWAAFVRLTIFVFLPYCLAFLGGASKSQHFKIQLDDCRLASNEQHHPHVFLQEHPQGFDVVINQNTEMELRCEHLPAAVCDSLPGLQSDVRNNWNFEAWKVGFLTTLCHLVDVLLLSFLASSRLVHLGFMEAVCQR